MARATEAGGPRPPASWEHSSGPGPGLRGQGRQSKDGSKLWVGGCIPGLARGGGSSTGEDRQAGSVQQAGGCGHHADNRVPLKGRNLREADTIRLSLREVYPGCHVQKALDRRGNVLRLIWGHCVVQAGSLGGPRPGMAMAPTEEKGHWRRGQVVVACARGLRETDGCWLAGLGWETAEEGFYVFSFALFLVLFLYVRARFAHRCTPGQAAHRGQVQEHQSRYVLSPGWLGEACNCPYGTSGTISDQGCPLLLR